MVNSNVMVSPGRELAVSKHSRLAGVFVQGMQFLCNTNLIRFDTIPFHPKPGFAFVNGCYHGKDAR